MSQDLKHIAKMFIKGSVECIKSVKLLLCFFIKWQCLFTMQLNSPEYISSMAYPISLCNSQFGHFQFPVEE